MSVYPERVQRLERVVLALHKLVVKCSCKMEKDIDLAKDLNGIAIELHVEKAENSPPDCPF